MEKLIKKNKVFILYLILGIVMDIVLRIFTTGNPYIVRPIFASFTFLLLMGSFSYLFKKDTSRYKYLLIVLIVFSIICIINSIYYEFYISFVSVTLISTSRMIWAVDDAVMQKIYIYHFIYLIFPLIMLLLRKKMLSNIIPIQLIKKDTKSFKKSIILGVFSLALLFATLPGGDYSKLVKLWNREYIVQRLGIYVYTINDIVQSIAPTVDTLFGQDKSFALFKDFYDKNTAKQENNEYTNYYKGHNIIFIHAESIQNFLIDLTINGVEITPNLNKLAKNSLYFSSFYPQISTGTSSDTEFTLSTGLMPVTNGTVFVNHSDNTYDTIQKQFKSLGYYTVSMHANNADYWNRKTMYQALGYDQFYAKESYICNEENMVGLGLSDMSFFEQSIDYLKDIKLSHPSYYATLITLSNHTPFDDTEKYGELDLSQTYYNENSNTYLKAPYLENTIIGNYLKSSHYADAAIGKFIEEAQKEGLLDNTLLVIYGDHEAKMTQEDLDLLYNYDPYTNKPLDKTDASYVNVSDYYGELIKNTPLIMYSKDKNITKQVTDVMGTYDIYPTLANMFGFTSKYTLGYDIFSNHEKIVIFPNGNYLTNKIYYNNLKDEFLLINNSDIIEADYVQTYKAYTLERLELSNSLIIHDILGELEKKKEVLKNYE